MLLVKLLLFPGALVAGAAQISLADAAISSAPPVIDLGYSRIQGYYDQKHSQYGWKGIRYASADRFQAPRIPAKHTAVVQNATDFGPICWQATEGATPLTSWGEPVGPQSEDCLFLNINAPAGAGEGSNFPVVIFIHGGGYAFGEAVTNSSFADFITNAGSDVVAVALQYRLGAFGFLAGTETSQLGVLNAGLLDQQFALLWVQDHIHKFGGDQSHVTIWGESAGAASVLNHIYAHGGETEKVLGLERPLFQAGIGSSVWIPPLYKYDEPLVEQVYQDLADAVGCANSSRGSFACLQAMDAGVLAGAALNISESAPKAYWTYVPVIEGEGGLITDRASVLLQQGKKTAGVEKVVGINQADEGFIFVDPALLDESTTDEDELSRQFDSLLASLFPLLTASERESVAEQYPITEGSATGNTFDRIKNVIADATLICPTYWFTEAFGSDGWKGIFAYGNAYHHEDVGYYQGPIWDGERSVSSVVSFTGALEGFVRTWDPNQNPAAPDLNPHWPTFDARKELLFNTTTGDSAAEADPKVIEASSIKVYGTSQTEKCDFWRGSISVNAGL
ncbi:hypothetical protein JCM8202_002530 [Rhodotorula sphaerocarpa]